LCASLWADEPGQKRTVSGRTRHALQRVGVLSTPPTRWISYDEVREEVIVAAIRHQREAGFES
jgi:hypothetical protein